MINPETGEVRFPGESIFFSPATRRQDMERLPAGMVVESRPGKPGCEETKLAEIQIGEHPFSRSILFKGDRLQSIRFACSHPQFSASGDDWRTKESERRELHEALLKDIFGPGGSEYGFPWGTVISGSTKDTCESFISVSYHAARIQLRPFAPSHLLALIEGKGEFHQAFGARAAEGLRGFFVGGDIPEAWLQMLRTSTGPDPWTHGFAVVLATRDLVVGTAGFKGPPDADGVVEVAYGIVPSYEGRGCATSVLEILVNFASADPRVRLIRAHTLPLRNASGRVLEKNGFMHTGEVTDPADGPVWRWERKPWPNGMKILTVESTLQMPCDQLALFPRLLLPAGYYFEKETTKVVVITPGGIESEAIAEITARYVHTSSGLYQEWFAMIILTAKSAEEVPAGSMIFARPEIGTLLRLTS